MSTRACNLLFARRLTAALVSAAMALGCLPVPGLEWALGTKLAYAEEEPIELGGDDAVLGDVTDLGEVPELAEALEDEEAAPSELVDELTEPADELDKGNQESSEDQTSEPAANAEEAWYDQERDRDMLPGWDGTINREYHVHVRDTETGDEWDSAYQVTGVEVISGVEHLSDYHRDEDGDDYWWYYRAGSMGDVTFEVTYLDLEGAEQSYQFSLHIGGVVYDAWIDASEMGEHLLPGSRVDLYAHGRKQTWTSDGGDGGTYEEETAGFEFAWSIEEGSGIASIEVNAADSSHAILTIGDAPSGEEEPVTVSADMSEEGSNVANTRWGYLVSTDYVEIFPTALDRSLGLGQDMSVPFEVRHYATDFDMTGGYRTIDDAQLSFWFDGNAFDIYDDESGNPVVNNASLPEGADEGRYDVGTFRLVRKGTWGTQLNVRASWDDDEHRECWSGYWFDNLNYDMWFDEDRHDINLWVTPDGNGGYTDFVDEENSVQLGGQLGETEGLTIDFVVGTWNGRTDEWTETFGPESGLYEVTDDGFGIRSNAAAMAEQGITDLRVEAIATFNGQEVCRTHNDFWFHLRERRYDMDREHDRDMLPGWDGTVNGSYHMWVEDEDYPDGWDGEYRVAAVEVVSGREHLSDFHHDEDGEGNHWWYYRAGEHGTAVLEVTYLDLEGMEQSYTFTLNIGSEVWEVETWTDPSTDVHPGESIEIYASGRHMQEEVPTQTEGFIYEWECDESEGYTFEVDADDPTHATVTFRPLDPGEDPYRYFYEARPEVVLYEMDDAGNKIERKRQDVRVAAVGWDFYTIEPTSIDPELDMFCSETIEPQVLFVHVDDAGNAVSEPVQPDGLTYIWHFDQNAVYVEDSSGHAVSDGQEVQPGTFTLTRLREWGTNINLEARWTEDGEERGTGVDYRLVSKEYQIAFDADTYETCEECVVVATLDTSKISGLPKEEYELDIYVGEGEWNEDTGSFEHVLAEDEYDVAEGEGTITITIPGASLAAHDWAQDGTWIIAGYYFPEYDGLPEYACNSEVLLTEENTHVLTRVPRKEATLTAAGNIEYWLCKKCGRAYVDESATTGTNDSMTIDEGGTIILQLIDVAKATVSGVAAKTYTGKALTQSPKVVVGGATLKSGTDYTLSYKNNVNVGTATLTITGKGAYGGTKAVTFKINAASVAKATVSGVAAKTYTGKAQTQSPKVVVDGKTLKAGTDYTLSYKNNVNAGTATLTITGKGNYTGTKAVTFKINADSVAKATVSGVAAKTYTGKAQTQSPKVVVGGKTLKAGTDYALSYKNNVNAGTATLTITGKGNYAGTKAVTFKINAASIAKATVANVADQTYTGKAIKPSPKVTFGGKMLKAGTDYTLAYANNVAAGTATITVTGKGNFSGTKKVTFKINAAMKEFPDVPKSHWAHDAIGRAAALGLMSGYDDGSFGPSDSITRGQIAVMLWNMAGKPKAGAGAKSFPDVKPGAYYEPAVAWASSVGVVSGYANNTFGPNDQITREQLCVMCANYVTKVAGKKASGSAADYAKMPDGSGVSTFARPSVGWAYRVGVLPILNGKLDAKSYADRAQAAWAVLGTYDAIQ